MSLGSASVGMSRSLQSHGLPIHLSTIMLLWFSLKYDEDTFVSPVQWELGKRRRSMPFRIHLCLVYNANQLAKPSQQW
jgi:hypothetical protein